MNFSSSSFLAETATGGPGENEEKQSVGDPTTPYKTQASPDPVAFMSQLRLRKVRLFLLRCGVCSAVWPEFRKTMVVRVNGKEIAVARPHPRKVDVMIMAFLDRLFWRKASEAAEEVVR